MTKFRASAAIEPQEIVFNGDEVLVASNITPYEEEYDGHTLRGFTYDCERYTTAEYLVKLTHENAQLKQDIIDTQLALVELYEGGDL